MSRRVAAIDVGTNTTQLLVVEEQDGAVQRLTAAERFVRLGEDVDERGKIGDAAKKRLLNTLGEYLETARSYDVDRVYAAGTSALREAGNRDQVIAAAQSQCGLSLETLSGSEEAAWSFVAACSAVESLVGPCLVIDIGGGSTELVAGAPPSLQAPRPSETLHDRASLPVGCVRLTERCFASLPPSTEEIERAKQDIDDALGRTRVDTGTNPTVLGTAGTATALALVDAGPEASRKALHETTVLLNLRTIRRWRERLLDRSEPEIRALHPEAMKGRADVFPIGVLILERVLTHYHCGTLYVSPHELRHGLALRALRAPSG